jgi:hypothetical protein
MRKQILILFLLIISKILFAQKEVAYSAFIKKADSLYIAKDYKNSALAYSNAFKSFGWKGYKHDRFHAAQAWAMSNTPDSAFDCLNRIIKKRIFNNYDSVINEKAFTVLHADKRWQALLNYIVLLKKYPLPKDWYVPPAIPDIYMIGIDKASGKNGSNAATIFCTEWEKGISFGNLMQYFEAEKYIGKRLRMSAWMKSKDVTTWAAFWMRVDQANSSQQLAFDNMMEGGKENRPIKGTTDWKKYEIVLDIPEKASNIVFGTMLMGNGQIWFDDFKFEIVDKTVPTTGKDKKDAANLGFEEEEDKK